MTLIFSSTQFVESAIWARCLEGFPANTLAFLARANHPDLGETLFMASFLAEATQAVGSGARSSTRGPKGTVRLALVHGEDCVKSMAVFMCKVKQNSRIFQVKPLQTTIMKHYRSEEDYKLGDEPQWTQMKEGRTLKELMQEANNNHVSSADYNFKSNNCQSFAKHMYDACTAQCDPCTCCKSSSLLGGDLPLNCVG